MENVSSIVSDIMKLNIRALNGKLKEQYILEKNIFQNSCFKGITPVMSVPLNKDVSQLLWRQRTPDNYKFISCFMEYQNRYLLK